MASRSATSFSARYTPASRTVVNPDSSVTLAFTTDSNTPCDAVFLSCDVGSAFSFCAPSARCVWQSINPGSTVFVERSSTFAPGRNLYVAANRRNLFPAQQNYLLLQHSPIFHIHDVPSLDRCHQFGSGLLPR